MRTVNDRGSVVMWGLILSGMIGATTIAAHTYFENFSRQARTTQIRSRLTSLEALVRTMAFQPYSYKCGSDNGADQVSDISSCTINPDYYLDVAEVLMPGAECPPGVKACGFKLSSSGSAVRPTLTVMPGNPVGVFDATITYEGREAVMRPSEIRLEIPTELLQSSQFDCMLANPNKPVLTGFDANGKPNCRGFSPVVNGVPRGETQPCPKGSYATQVNWASLTIICSNLDGADKVVGCPQDQALTQVRWADGRITSQCDLLPAAPFN